MENQTQPIQPQPPVQPTEPPMKPKKSFPKLPLIIAAVILVATLLTGAYFLSQKSNNKVACTLEAKICPDGSSVGRTGPKCEFSPCPKTPTPTPDPTANWKTYTNSTFGFSLKYPGDWAINDQSYPESQGIKAYIGFAISAPFRTDISSTNGEKAQYLRMVHWDPTLKELVANDSSGKLGNFIYAKNPQDQAVRNVDVSDSFITNSQEYGIGNQILSTFTFTDQTPQGDESTNWKTYTNDKYGISLKYPAVWYPQDVTNIAPGDHLANIDFFANGTTPSISTEGHQGNELLNFYISNNLNGQTVVDISKEQFLSQWTGMRYKATTISNLPAVSTQNGHNNYLIWYNDKIILSIYSNDPSVDKTTFERIISTMTISPTQ